MAGNFFISIKGNKQGQFKAETGKNSTEIPIYGFSYGVTSPRDPATGQSTGKRQHKPITIYKEWGVCSVQMFQALVTNEVLEPDGKEATYMEIRLTNAAISATQVDPQRLDDAPVWTDHEIEQVSLTFEKIEIENFLSKSTAADDWDARV
jgi:type VI secretion system secreted protein Hcp